MLVSFEVICMNDGSKPYLLPAVLKLVRLQDGSKVPFKVKMTTAFEKLFKAYCSKKALDAATLVFLTSEGQRILGHQTPADVSNYGHSR